RQLQRAAQEGLRDRLHARPVQGGLRHGRERLPLGEDAAGLRQHPAVTSPAAHPQAPPSSPVFKSGFGGCAPSQMERNARAKSSPSTVPLVVPPTSTLMPAPGTWTKVIRSPDFMSAIHPLRVSTRSLRAGSWSFALAANPSSHALRRSEAPTLRTKCKTSSFGAGDPRRASGSVEGCATYRPAT